MTKYIAFCKIVECKSFTRAAEALGYTQAAVSQMVRTLEKELSVTLFVRSRKEILLTGEGEALYPFVKKLVNSHNELFNRVAEITGLSSGEVRIGTFSSMSQRLLPGAMSDFGREYPGIRFVLSQGDNTTLPEQIRNGSIDFGFVYPEASSGLVSIPIASDSFLAVFPEGHPLAGKDSVTLREMSKEPLILTDEGGINTVLAAFEKENITPDIKYRIHDDHTILSMVEKGIGVSILPSMILDRASYRIKTVPIKKPVTRTVGISYLSDELLPIASKRFIEFLRDNIAKYLPKESSVKE
ncbi:MAG: LysR family transcriptional regulator [Clostridia bacterium]|nr:LysR family transcriptional regulator [Clostridia bacterium]